MRKWQYLSAKQTLVIGFLLIILIGAFLLMLSRLKPKQGGHPVFKRAVYLRLGYLCNGTCRLRYWTQFSAFGQAVIKC
jgi:hypothetical protein